MARLHKKDKRYLYAPARIYTKRINQSYQHISFVYRGKRKSFKQLPPRAWKIASKHQPDMTYILYRILLRSCEGNLENVVNK